MNTNEILRDGIYITDVRENNKRIIEVVHKQNTYLICMHLGEVLTVEKI